MAPAIQIDHPASAPIHLTVAGRIQSSSQLSCIAARGPFRIEPAKSGSPSIDISLPSPDRWLADLEGKAEPDSSVELETLDEFLADADALQQGGCFPDTPFSIRDFILQNIPMRPQESYYNAYGYRLGRRGIDLKPGVRVKIERAYFRPPNPGEEEYGAKTFLGLSTVYFDVETTAENKTTFHQVSDIQYAPASLKQTAAEGTKDLALASQPPARRYRLFFYSYQVAEKQKRSAAIIGSDDVSQLDAVDQELRANPEQSCTDAVSHGNGTCLAFDGFVTLSTQIKVVLDGQLKFVEWGVRLKDVLPKTFNKRDLKSLQIQRRSGSDRYYEVSFDRNEPTILSLVLVGGDRVTWSARRNK